MLHYLRLKKPAYCGFVLTVPSPKVPTVTHDNARSHVTRTHRLSGGAQIILELMGVTPHVSLIRVDVALPVDHRSSVVTLIGDRIDTSGERAWARAIREQRINRPFGDKPRAHVACPARRSRSATEPVLLS